MFSDKYIDKEDNERIRELLFEFLLTNEKPKSAFNLDHEDNIDVSVTFFHKPFLGSYACNISDIGSSYCARYSNTCWKAKALSNRCPESYIWCQLYSIAWLQDAFDEYRCGLVRKIFNNFGKQFKHATLLCQNVYILSNIFMGGNKYRFFCLANGNQNSTYNIFLSCKCSVSSGMSYFLFIVVTIHCFWNLSVISVLPNFAKF